MTRNLFGFEARARGKLPQPVMERFLDDLRLLDAGEMRRLFPGAKIEIERFCGLEKSILALRPRPESDIGL